MKILLLTPQLPYPPQQGTSLRNYYIARGLSESHQVTLLSFVAPGQPRDAAVIEPLLAACDAVYMVDAQTRSRTTRLWQLISSRQPDMAHRLASLAFDLKLRELLSTQYFDVVQIEGIELAQRISLIRAASPASRILFDDHNAETALQWRAFLTDVRQPRRWLAAAYSLVQVTRLRRLEQWACLQADWVTAVSEADRAQLQKLVPGQQVTVIPNCIDVTAFHDSLSVNRDPSTGRRPLEEDHGSRITDHELLFVGKMDYRPNVDAVLWFADEVWPKIKAARPEATWAIVGQRPDKRLEKLRIVKGINITGPVETIRPFLQAAKVVVLPFRMGSGTRLKLIEALAAGKAIVSTPLGVEGVPFADGEHGRIAATPAQLAEAVISLLDDPAERARLGEGARRLAIDYDWRIVIPRFDSLLRAS